MEQNKLLKFNEFRISKYNVKDKTNEGLKSNLLAGLLTLFASTGLVKGETTDKKTHVYNTEQEYQAKFKKNHEHILRAGYKLTSSQIDTLFNEIKTKSPESDTLVMSIRTNQNTYFASGSFELNPFLTEDIDSVLNEALSKGYVLLGIDISSSTDKQKIGPKLQDKLKEMGYSPDNNGLSSARAEAVMEYLTGEMHGISDDVISIYTLAEQGTEIIDEKFRYVQIDFKFVISNVSEASETQTQVKRTISYEREEELGSTRSGVTKKAKKISYKSTVKNFKLKKVKNYSSPKQLKCPKY